MLNGNVVAECEWIYIRDVNEYGIIVVNCAATLVKPTVSAGYNKFGLDDLRECEQSKLARMERFFTFLAWQNFQVYMRKGLAYLPNSLRYKRGWRTWYRP